MRLRPLSLLAFLLLGALAGAQQTMPEGLYIDEGTTTGGSLRSLYAFDANALSVASAPDGNGIPAASLSVAFHVPTDAPSAVLHAETGTAPDGGTVQAYLYSPSAGGLALGAQTPSNGVVEFALTGTQLAQYRDASGALNVQFRAVRPSGAFTWSVERLVVLTPILSYFVYDNEGGHASGTLASLPAVDGDFYTLTTAAEASGNGNVSASFSVGYRVPAGTPSATLRAVTGLAGGGGDVQAFTYYAAVGGTELWDAAAPSAQNTVDVPITSSQIATYRDASGVLNVQFRVYAPASSVPAGTAWNTDQLVLWAAPNNGPALPTALAASPVSSSRIDLGWTDNANNETGYVVERKGGADADFVQVGTANADATVYHDSGLTASTAYTYRVHATNDNGDSPNSNEAGATTNARPVPPSVLASMSLQDDYIMSGSGTVLTVNLSATRTAPTTITINHPSGLTIPAVVVPAGATSASVPVSSSSSTPPTIYSLVGSLEGWKQKCYLVVTPNSTPFAINALSVRTGQGVALLSWASQREEIFGTTIKGFEVWRRNGSTEQKISAVPSPENRFLDAHCTQAGTQYKVRMVTRMGAVVSESAWIDATPSANSPTIGLTSTPTGVVTDTIDVGIDRSSLQGLSGILYVDGIRSGDFDGAKLPSNPSTVLLDATHVSSGSHECIIVADAGSSIIASTTFQINVSAHFDALKIQDVVDQSAGDVAQFSFDAQDAPDRFLRAQIIDDSGTVIRTFQSSADKLQFAWDGKDQSGNSLANGQYAVKLSFVDSDDPNSYGPSPYTFEGYVCNVLAAPQYLSLGTLFKGSETEDKTERDKIVDVFRSRATNNGLYFLALTVPEGTRTSAILRSKIRYWITNSVTCFHVSAHGNPYTSSFFNQTWTAVEWGGLRMHPYTEVVSENGYYVDDIYPESEFCVNRFVPDNQYKFVFLDTCFSGTGGVYDLNPLTGHCGISSSAWAQAFKINDLDETFIGWDGLISQNKERFTSISNPNYGMLYYRLSFWDNLREGGTVLAAKHAGEVSIQNFPNLYNSPTSSDVVNGQTYYRFFFSGTSTNSALP